MRFGTLMTYNGQSLGQQGFAAGASSDGNSTAVDLPSEDEEPFPPSTQPRPSDWRMPSLSTVEDPPGINDLSLEQFLCVKYRDRTVRFCLRSLGSY